MCVLPLLLHGVQQALWGTCHAGYTAWTSPWLAADPGTVWWCLWELRWLTSWRLPEMKHNQLKEWLLVYHLVQRCLTSETYHYLSFVWTSSSPALCRKHLHILADAAFGDHWVVDGGFNKHKADSVIFNCELQGGDGLRKTSHHKTRKWETLRTERLSIRGTKRR